MKVLVDELNRAGNGKQKRQKHNDLRKFKLSGFSQPQKQIYKNAFFAQNATLLLNCLTGGW